MPHVRGTPDFLSSLLTLANFMRFLNESRTRGCWWRPVQEVRIRGPKTIWFDCFSCPSLDLFVDTAKAMGASPVIFTHVR